MNIRDTDNVDFHGLDSTSKRPVLAKRSEDKSAELRTIHEFSQEEITHLPTKVGLLSRGDFLSALRLSGVSGSCRRRLVNLVVKKLVLFVFVRC